MKGLSKALKNQITADWQSCIPSLGIFKPMHLLRRCGPLLVGVCLERDSSSTEYRPTFHTHVLGKQFPTVSLTLSQPLLTERTKAPQSIHIAHHSGQFKDAAFRLRHQALLPFEGPVTLEQALDAYRGYACRPTTHYPIDLFEDMILLTAWCGQVEGVSSLIETAREEVSSWPPQVVSSLGGVEQWVSRVLAFSESDYLLNEVEAEIIRLKIDSIPASALPIHIA